MPKQQQTLFSFFSPKTKPESRPTLSEKSDNSQKSPEPAKKRPSESESPTVNNAVKQAKLAVKSPTKYNVSECSFSPGDLVWARMEGYPWWPSLVCNHPTKNTHAKAKKSTEIHVQFFDEPPTRGWVREKYVRQFKGLDVPDCRRGGLFYSADPDQYKAGKKAEAARELSHEARLEKLLVDIPSDEDEDEEEPMVLENSDLFDNEASGDEAANTSKESHDSAKENKEQKTEKADGDEEKKEVPTPKKKSRTGRPLKKRRRIATESGGEEDSEDEFIVKDGEGETSESDSGSSGEEEKHSSEGSNSDDDSPVKQASKRKRPTASKPAENKKTPARKPTATSSAIKQFRMPSLPDDSSPPAKSAPPTKPASKPETPNRPSPFSAATPKNDATPKRVFSPSPSVSDKTKSKLAAFSAPVVDPDQPTNEDGQLYSHLTFEHLKPEKIKDKNKKRPDEEGYDGRTLFVPADFLKSQTPAHKQWWLMKIEHYDTVLFFKVGKFYELFHMDAVVGVKELGLIYMKGAYAHSGFPEIAYGRYADILVQRGYKVARVEQTETPDMMTERIKTTPSRGGERVDKVVRREICRITTKGTKTFSFIDGNAPCAENSFLLAVCEREVQGRTQMGVCFVDTSIGKFRLGQFTDDRHGSRFRTLIAHYNPVQILYERGRLSATTQQLISNMLPTVVKEALTPSKEFWDASKTLKVLSEGEYFEAAAEGGSAEGGSAKGGSAEWPEALKGMLSDQDSLGLTAAEEKQLAVSALGAVTWYLSDCLLDHELLSLRQFHVYTPIDEDSARVPAREKDHSAEFMDRASMVLDGVTLANLEVVENSTTGTLEGTLLDRLDSCSTPFGKRLFRQWLCAPLCNPDAINQRLDAVDDLIRNYDLVSEVKESMRKLPDLERLLSKIHTMGSATRSKTHPDARAIFYEDVIYSKRKIEDFLDTLSGFRRSLDIVKKLESVVPDLKSDLLKKTVGLPGQGRFPDISDKLKFFATAFDHDQARKQGKIIPADGVDEEYDNAVQEICECEKKFQVYLKEQKNELGAKNLVYWGTGRNRYQIEIPEALAKRVPNNYTLKSSKKGYKRYWSDEIEEMLSELTAAEDRKDAALRDVMRGIFNNFDQSYSTWERCVQCMAVLDVLVCMADYSRCGDGDMCRPQIINPRQSTDEGCSRPFLEIREGRHPCITRTYSGGDFIPNDIIIGAASTGGDGDGPRGQGSLALVTGPNMGGKSTLMRQAGLVVILAQMGCYVPCSSCRLTPVDRIFTRLGASDRIMAGESTFYVELSETAAILQHASRHSLILMDELGRGTATYDGTAIASAVVREISENIACRTLFSTHYHSLVEDFSHDPNVTLGHMACMVENEDDEDPSQETITFLYKFIAGACPKSYGFNAARLAQLPEEVIRTAHKKARDFEESLEKLKLFRALQNTNSDNLAVEIEKARTLVAVR